MNDEFDLQRFLQAQDGTYDAALGMLRQGTMCSAYIDFIFPRLQDGRFGRTRYGMSSLGEARAYLAFPILGDRYRECVYALGWLGEMVATNVLGEEDAVKVHASLTLFAEASGEPLFRTMLAVWFDNTVDEATIVRLDPVRCGAALAAEQAIQSLVSR